MKLYKNLLLPNEYHHTIYDINYDEKKNQGIKYALFDLDGTIVPFDSLYVDEKHIEFFNGLNERGLKTALYSDGKESRVKPIIKELQVPYICRAKKPFGKFKIIHNLFGEDCNPYNTMLIGNISFLDTVFANKVGMYNVLVDTLRAHFNFKAFVCDVGDAIFTYPIKDELKEYGIKKPRK